MADPTSHCDDAPVAAVVCRRRGLGRTGLVLGWVVLVLLASGGCERIHNDARLPMPSALADATPVILIPGAEASSLETADGRMLWTGSAAHLLDPNAFARLAEPMMPDASASARVVAADVIRGVPGQDYYGGLIERLEARAGAPCVLPDAVGPQTRCVLYPWDWRRDLVRAAAGLDQLIERLRRTRGEPTLRVDLLGHSAGGLVVRYFVRFGGRDVLGRSPEEVRVDFAGAPKVRRAALIGVPNTGAAFWLKLMMRGHQLGLVSLRPELMAVMPSAYQALPHPDHDWLLDTSGRPVDRDLYDPETWRALRQSIFDPAVRRRLRASPGGERRLAAIEAILEASLERGRRLQLALNRPVAQPFAYDVFAGDCTPTLARFVEERIGGVPELRFAPEAIIHPRPGVDYAARMYRSGDGWITRSSALGRGADGRGQGAGRGVFAIDNTVLGCGPHGGLPALDAVRNTLVGLLAMADAHAQGRGWVPGKGGLGLDGHDLKRASAAARPAARKGRQ